MHDRKNVWPHERGAYLIERLGDNLNNVNIGAHRHSTANVYVAQSTLNSPRFIGPARAKLIVIVDVASRGLGKLVCFCASLKPCSPQA